MKCDMWTVIPYTGLVTFDTWWGWTFSRNFSSLVLREGLNKQKNYFYPHFGDKRFTPSRQNQPICVPPTLHEHKCWTNYRILSRSRFGMSFQRVPFCIFSSYINSPYRWGVKLLEEDVLMTKWLNDNSVCRAAAGCAQVFKLNPALLSSRTEAKIAGVQPDTGAGSSANSSAPVHYGVV